VRERAEKFGEEEFLEAGEFFFGGGEVSLEFDEEGLGVFVGV